MSEAPARVAPDPAAAPHRATAHRSLAHVRAEPRHAAELVTQMILGEQALVLSARVPWLQVRLADGYTGWVHQGSVVRSAVDDLEAFARALDGPPGEDPGAWIVVARGQVLREGPEPGSPQAADLVQGARVRVEDPGHDPLAATLPDGTTGWLDRQAALPATRLAERFPPNGEALVEHAADFLGLPYLWGGTSEKGFDCSGLVQRIYGLHGIRLPRDAGPQSRSGEPVDPGPGWRNVRAGDLAFFVEPPGTGVTHVGILAPGGRLIHASTTRNGVAWDVLPPAGTSTPLGERLAGWLSGIRRVLPG
ncbi:MAG TPA: NlpC/P60 family protein [Gemmatimonadota bacterium]|nr:NlpC/P60 family protein [Gemmatimonadota bacterium]